MSTRTYSPPSQIFPEASQYIFLEKGKSLQVSARPPGLGNSASVLGLSSRTQQQAPSYIDEWEGHHLSGRGRPHTALEWEAFLPQPWSKGLDQHCFEWSPASSSNYPSSHTKLWVLALTHRGLSSTCRHKCLDLELQIPEVVLHTPLPLLHHAEKRSWHPSDEDSILA